MRLLKRKASGWFMTTYDFSLVEYDARKTPHYAILSHRWGSDEVTFKDIEHGTARAKAGGYKKLKFCAEQADRDGLMYFWVDTCCIDKTNSTELSEAINSMFQWYKNATKCYVYLPDVSAGPEQEVAFLHSEWFNRGWTLQELIAPSVVEFFSVEGIKLGNKESLARDILQASGISIEVLQGKPLSEIDESERFSWTVRRKTTKEEDAVYCLLGIFDVHMPLIYGEGRSKALARLQREIRLAANPELFSTRDTSWIVPFERNPLFTGRKTELADIEGKLFVKDSTSKIAITGLGGVGKTQLVLELLHRTKRKHPACSILWIAASTIESLRQGYIAVARQLNIPGHDDEEADVKQLVQDYLSRDDTGRWLLVFDNADDVDMWTAARSVPHDRGGDGISQRTSNSPRRLIDYLPKSRQGCIVFTTRNREAAVKFAQPNILTVHEMNQETATELLQKLLSNVDLASHPQDVSALLAALTYLPLAIAQAAAYIAAKNITLTDYISLLQEKDEEVIDILSEDFEASGRYQDIGNPVATTWLISFEQIRQLSPLAAAYLSFIACIDPKDIPQSILPPGPSRKKELDAIGILSAYSLITWRSNDAVLNVHRLVHMATRNWLGMENSLSQWTEDTIVHLAKVFPDSDHRNRSIWRSYLPHALHVLACGLVSKDKEQTALLLSKCGMCLGSDERWIEAEGMFNKARMIHSEALGADHPDTLTSMANLAMAYWNQGRWDEAEQLNVRVMEIYKAKLGVDHPDTLSSIGNLALIHSSQGRWDESEQLNVQVMEARKTKLGRDHPDTLNSMNNLAMTYWYQGRWKEAERLEIQVMETYKTKLGLDHPDTLTSTANLAFTWKSMGRGAEAIRLMEDCVQRQTRALGVDHLDSQASLDALEEWQAAQ